MSKPRIFDVLNLVYQLSYHLSLLGLALLASPLSFVINNYLLQFNWFNLLCMKRFIRRSFVKHEYNILYKYFPPFFFISTTPVAIEFIESMETVLLTVAEPEVISNSVTHGINLSLWGLIKRIEHTGHIAKLQL